MSQNWDTKHLVISNDSRSLELKVAPGQREKLQVELEFHESRTSPFSIEIYLEKDSQLELSLAPFGTHQCAVDVRGELLERSQLKFFPFLAWGRHTRLESTFLLKKPESSLHIAGASRSRTDQMLNASFRVVHDSPYTRSQTRIWSIAEDFSTTEIHPLLRIPFGSKGSKGTQHSYNLILSKRARIESTPELEIQESEVECRHGASFSPIDDDQIFYLRSRGFTADFAQRLLVDSFASEAFIGLPNTPSSERIKRAFQLGDTHAF